MCVVCCVSCGVRVSFASLCVSVYLLLLIVVVVVKLLFHISFVCDCVLSLVLAVV